MTAGASRTPDAASASDDVAAQVRAAQQAAREQQPWLDKIDHVAAHDPHAEAWARYFLQQNLALSRQARRYLRSRFRADVGRLHFLDPRRVPRTEDDWRRFLGAYRTWRLHMALADAMAEAGYRAIGTSEDPWRAAMRAHVRVIKLAPWLHAVEMVGAPLPALREEAAIAFAGWAATQTSARFGRLRKALGGGSPHDVHRALLEQLPGAVIEAFGDLDPNSDPLIIRTHAAEILAGGGERRRKRRPPFAVGRPTQVVDGRLDIDPQRMLHRLWNNSPSMRPHLTQAAQASLDVTGIPWGDLLRDAVSGKPSPVDAALRDFELREGASAAHEVDEFELREAARSLMSTYGLSERQAEVAYLRSELRWSHGRIAGHLDITASASRSHLAKAGRKLKRAM